MLGFKKDGNDVPGAFVLPQPADGEGEAEVSQRRAMFVLGELKIFPAGAGQEGEEASASSKEVMAQVRFTA